MKYVARVEHVLRSGIHKVAVGRRGPELIFEDLPLPTYVEIVMEESGEAMMYRYRDDGTFCGDTWHENLAHARAQAEYEYGLGDDAWQRKEDQ